MHQTCICIRLSYLMQGNSGPQSAVYMNRDRKQKNGQVFMDYKHLCSGAPAVVDSSQLGSYNGRFIQVFSYARLGGLHYAHPLDLVVMLACPQLCCSAVSVHCHY